MTQISENTQRIITSNLKIEEFSSEGSKTTKFKRIQPKILIKLKYVNHIVILNKIKTLTAQDNIRLIKDQQNQIQNSKKAFVLIEIVILRIYISNFDQLLIKNN